MKLNPEIKKKYRIRNKLKKNSPKDRYRLSVSRSSKNISAQIIDDSQNITLVSASSMSKEFKQEKKNKTELSLMVAELLAKKAQDKNIKKIYFDRGVYKYHGRVKIFERLEKMEWSFNLWKKITN